MQDQFPALQERRTRSVDIHKVDEVRRILWRAFQHGGLSEEEFASTLDRLDFESKLLEPGRDAPSTPPNEDY